MGRVALCLLVSLACPWVQATAAHAQAPPTQQRQGTIRGTVLDASSGRPVIGAGAEVVEMKKTATRTDLDGHFDIDVAPGTYRVRLSAPLYESKVLENVKVVPGETTRLSATLTPKVDTSVEVIEVVADVTAATEATQLLKRKLAPTISETLGAESISKTPDSDAAEVVTRVPAVTIKDDKFLIVRGLNERYSSALLNDSRLPSTDPNRRIVPLDLFPADFIESLTVIKSYTPDLPGDFAGGLVNIRLAEPPRRFTYSIGMSTGFNTETTFQNFNTYDGSTERLVRLRRRLPCPAGPLRPLGRAEQPDDATDARLVGSLPNNWDVHTETAPPNFGVNGSVGSTVGPLGVGLAAVYGTKHKVRRNEVLNGFQEPALFDQGFGSNFVYDRSTFETELGAVFTSDYKLTINHKIEAAAWYNRKSTDEVLDGRASISHSHTSKPQFARADLHGRSARLGQLEGHPPLLPRRRRLARRLGPLDRGSTRFEVRTTTEARDERKPDLSWAGRARLKDATPDC